MTGITVITAINMVGTFTDCSHVVVTTGAGADHLIMIDIIGCHRRPWCWPGLVARITHIGSTHVRCGLTRSDDVVMATGTAADDFVMINIS